MELGIISWIEEENFRKAKELGLSFVELDVNDRAEEFLSHLDQVISFSKAYEMPVGAMGRWGSDRISKDGIRPPSPAGRAGAGIQVDRRGIPPGMRCVYYWL